MTLHESQFDEFFGNPLPHEGFTIAEPAHEFRISRDGTSPSFLPQERGEQESKGTQQPPKARNGRREGEEVLPGVRTMSGLKHNWKKLATVVGLSIVAFLLVKSMRLSRGEPNIE